MTNLIEVSYNQTGTSKHLNHLGMRQMQQKVYTFKSITSILKTLQNAIFFNNPNYKWYDI